MREMSQRTVTMCGFGEGRERSVLGGRFYLGGRLFGESPWRMRIMFTWSCHQKGSGVVGRYFFIITIIIFMYFKGDMHIALPIQFRTVVPIPPWGGMGGIMEQALIVVKNLRQCQTERFFFLIAYAHLRPAIWMKLSPSILQSDRDHIILKSIKRTGMYLECF